MALRCRLIFPLMPTGLSTLHRPSGRPRGLSASGRQGHLPVLQWERASMSTTFQIEIEREDDGRWIAEVPDLSGV